MAKVNFANPGATGPSATGTPDAPTSTPAPAPAPAAPAAPPQPRRRAAASPAPAAPPAPTPPQAPAPPAAAPRRRADTAPAPRRAAAPPPPPAPEPEPVEEEPAVEETAPAPAPAPITPPAKVWQRSQVPQVAQPPALPAVASNKAFFADDSDIEFGDILIPPLNIVQGVGELSQLFDKGEIVLDRQLPLPRPVRVVCVGLTRKRYVERVEGADGEGGNIAYSREEVASLGGTTLYADAQTSNRPWYQTLVTGCFLVEKHEALTDELDSGFFQFEYVDPATGESKWYALAKMNFKGTSYTYGAQPLMTARKIGRLRTGYSSGWWTIDTRSHTTRNRRVVVAPVLRHGDATTPEFQHFVAECLGASAEG